MGVAGGVCLGSRTCIIEGHVEDFNLLLLVFIQIIPNNSHT